MKNFVIKYLLLNIGILQVLGFSTPKKDDISNNSCKYRNLTEEGTYENQQFVNFIFESQNLDEVEENVQIEYYDDGTVYVTHILSEDEIVIYSPLSDKEIEQYNQSDSMRISPGAAIWWAIVQIYKLAGAAGQIANFICNIIEMTGNGNPCDYITNSIIDSLANGTTARYEVAQYIYKDPACPYPPNSLQCSQPPYAYKKTYLKRIN